jgi:glycosyltransferase involved in cell wall biosynthesis
LDKFTGVHEDKRLKEELGIPQDAPVVSLIGRLARLKGQDVFLRAAAFVAQSAPHTKILLVGGTLAEMDSDFPDMLREMANDLGIAHQVIMTGHRDDIERFYRASDIVVLASTKSESFGLVLVEAMACEKPVIATKVGGPLEIVEDGRTGLLVPPGDAFALADAISRLIKDATLRKEMGKAGAQRARQLFSDQRMGEDLAKVYLNTVHR